MKCASPPQSEESRVREAKEREHLMQVKVSNEFSLVKEKGKSFQSGYDCALKHSPTIAKLVEALRRKVAFEEVKSTPPDISNLEQQLNSIIDRSKDNQSLAKEALAAYEQEIK